MRSALIITAIAAATVPAVACMDDPDGPTVVKFCHQFHRGGQPISLTLELGPEPITRMTAMTGSCTPDLGEPCMLIHTGKIHTRIIEGDHALIDATVPMEGGHEYLMYPVVTALGQLAVEREPLSASHHCMTTEPLLLMNGKATVKPDGGATTGTSRDSSPE